MADISALTQSGMKSFIRKQAFRHGFSRCNFTAPKLPAEHVQALETWVADGMQAEMAWMSEPERLARRKSPEQLLAGVRTVITVAMRYTPPQKSGLDDRDCGVISAYAHGDDYHEIMKKRLKALARDLDEKLGRHDQRVFVDTAPVLEHALAESAGLAGRGNTH